MKEMKKRKQVIQKDKKTFKKRKSVFTIGIFAIVLIIAVCFIFMMTKNIYLNVKYKDYKVKIEQYGLNKLYNNDKASSYQRVSNSEALKLIIGGVLNIEDAKGLANLSATKYENEDFVMLAYQMGIINKDEINEKNENKLAKKDFISKVLKNTVKVYLKEDFVFETDCKLSKKIYKGELNKIIVKIVEKYNTIYFDKDDNKEAYIVTDKDKMPKNYLDYPYIISNITNDEYEMPFQIKDESRKVLPKDSYYRRKEMFKQIETTIETYFDNILNIDYTKINTDTLTKNTAGIFTYEYSKEDFARYVSYVKENQIKLEGNVKVLLPIIYNDGEFNRVRVKINFKVLNAKTDKNILLPDIASSDNIKYEGKEFEFYADLSMGIILTGDSLRINLLSIADDTINYDKIKREEIKSTASETVEKGGM